MKIKTLQLLTVASSMLLLACSSNKKAAITDLTPYLGVWANADCELVQTQKYTLLFERDSNKISAILRQNELTTDTLYSKFFAGFVFDTSDTTYEKITPTVAQAKIPFESYLRLTEGQLTLHGAKTQTLTQIEKLESTMPYEMPYADSTNIGQCLQQWQTGVFAYDLSAESPHIEIGTNRHSYMFMSSPQMLYCRAARIRHNDHGSLFAQNIRLMFNNNSGEMTIEMEPDNRTVGSADLAIDNSKFHTDMCAFQQEGIYWSLISSTPDEILLNGCGATYTIDRPATDDKTLTEWFVFQRY